MPLDLPAGLDAAEIQTLIDTAIAEDIGAGDITSEAVIPPDTKFDGVMSARQDMVCAGLPIAKAIFETFSHDITFEALASDGDHLAAGANLARLGGPALALLTAERTAINMLQHLSGIATLTAKYADAIAGTGTILLDTRKTTPGLRTLQKYATRMGGATNHRMRLDDGVLIKDNHISMAGGVSAALDGARRGVPLLTKIEIECDTLDQAREAIAAGADMLLLDNMSLDQLREAVAIADGRVPLEASGGVTIDTVRGIAETGVDFISSGRITQSPPAADIGLDVILES